MTNIEIVKANIRAYGFLVGKSAGSKGTEIYSSGCFVDSFYKHSDLDENKKRVASLRRSILSKGYKNVFISRISFEDGSIYSSDKDERACFWDISFSKYNLKKIIRTNFKGIKSIDVTEIPRKVVGHLSISKYDADLEGQKELLKDMVRLHGKEVYGEVEDEWSIKENSMEFYYRYDDERKTESYTNGDYELHHGRCSTVEDTDDCVYVDGKCSPHNNDVLDDFWNFNGFDESDWYKELDPNEDIAIYSRKGKDFYVGYTLNSEECSLVWKNKGEVYFEGDFEEEVYSYLEYTPDSEKIKKVVEALKETKKDLENDSYVYNELEIDYYNNTWDWNDGVFDLHLLDLIFNDRREARNNIIDILDWDLPIAEACLAANERIIAENITFNLDMSFVVQEVKYFSDKVSNVETYNQLKVIKRLENRLGYKLVWSLVGNSRDTYGFAIKQGEEEYHFELKDLFEEGVNPIEFVQDCLVAFGQRKLKQMTDEELFERASHVFVGLSDSRAVGNCDFGTDEFLARNHIDTNSIGGIRGDALLELESSSFTKNMVVYRLMSTNAFNASLRSA